MGGVTRNSPGKFFTMSVLPSSISRNSFIINKNTSDPALKVVSIKFYHLFFRRVFYGFYSLSTRFAP